uniref:NADH-ubiquinone oxidoreductase chain 4L n=1 Tax=Rhagophthalmus giganteus TaxID=2591746 RepID=A0A5C0PWV1_9COLE|nr:NADH dehydrogenase subunit 4L [Rhagophthalmus giganteus]
MMAYSLLFFFMYMVGLIVLCLKCKHLLLMLLSLEFIVMSLYMGIYFVMLSYCYEYYFSMIFLTFSVCESSLGLSILVLMMRSYGNDYFQSLSLLW